MLSNTLAQPESLLCENCGLLSPGVHVLPRSPIPHLLRTNTVPSSTEAQAIRDTITDVQESISQLDQSIARARQNIKDLENERDAFSKFAEDHAMFLSPARRLYPDLWSEIFSYSRDEILPDRDIQDYNFLIGSSQEPLKITHICRAWRSIAISTPRLWSFIRISTTKVADFSTPRLPLIKTWLARSRAYPLTLCILGYNDDHLPAEQTRSIFRLLADQAYRWQDVHFIYPKDIIEIFTTIRTELVLPQIQNFTVYTRESVNLDVLHFGSSLDTLRICGSLNSRLSDIKLSKSAQPRRIELDSQDGVPVDMCLDVLGRWPNIETLHIHRHDSYIPTRSTDGPICHTHLRTLIVGSSRDSFYPRLLNELSFPSLQKFDLTIYARLDTSLATFLSRSPSITHFRVCIPSWMVESIAAIFRYLPTLTQLEVAAASVDVIAPGAILRILTFSMLGFDIFPQLQSIKLRRVGKLDSQDVIAFIRSRWRLDDSDGLRARIQSVSIHHCDPNFEGMQNMAELDEFRREGLHVEDLQF